MDGGPRLPSTRMTPSRHGPDRNSAVQRSPRDLSAPSMETRLRFAWTEISFDPVSVRIESLTSTCPAPGAHSRLMSASAGCGHAVALGYVREVPEPNLGHCEAGQRPPDPDTPSLVGCDGPGTGETHAVQPFKTARVHYASRRCSDRVAPRRARAAVGDAGNRVPQHLITKQLGPRFPGRVPPRSWSSRVRGWPKR